jgi:hypothetical protein
MHLNLRSFNGFIIAFICSIVFSFWAGLRDHDFGDTAVYLLFYEDLINTEFNGLESCQSFEPLFCTASYLLSHIFQYSLAVHYAWAFLFFIITYFSLSILIDNSFKYVWTKTIIYIFISINYVDPQIVFFLTRQYVASSLLTLGIALFISNRSPVIPFLSAALIHFGSTPIALILFIFFQIRKNNTSLVFFIPPLLLLLAYIIFVESYFLEIYFESIKLKLDDYSDRNDGDLTLAQEIKLIFYWSLAFLFLKKEKHKIHNSLIFIYAFYLITFVSELIHLRYFKYLESMSWIGILVLVNSMKKSTSYVITSLLSFRIYKYLTLISPESGIFYMCIFLLMNIYGRMYSLIY